MLEVAFDRGGQQGHDRAAAAAAQVGQRRVHNIEKAVHVGVDGLGEFFGRNVAEGFQLKRRSSGKHNRVHVPHRL